MLSALIITLRETLEASLIIGIILTYLNKTGNESLKKVVWYGVIAGIALSVIAAFVFEKYLGGFEGKYEELYEGIMMTTAAILIIWMVIWTFLNRNKFKENIENKIQTNIEKGNSAFGIFMLSMLSVAREGIETIIFLEAAIIESKSGNMFFGGVLGVVIAILISYIFFKQIKKIPLGKFLTGTGILLLIFAGSLLIKGAEEFEEAFEKNEKIENNAEENLDNDKSATGGNVVCPENYQPICGLKEIQCIKAPCEPVMKTYKNICYAVQDGAKIVDRGECGEKEGKPLEKPTKKTTYCTMEFDPVCGSVSGKIITFSNQCFAKISNAKILYKGECK